MSLKADKTNGKTANGGNAFAIYCALLHGWHRQPERFETFATRCAELSKIALDVAEEAKIV